VSDPGELNRLRWQCRRGMLELDLLLTEFLDTRYGSLTPAEQDSFRRLLRQPDQTLLSWFNGGADMDDQELREIVRKIG
jgi:antitoxin CptB